MKKLTNAGFAVIGVLLAGTVFGAFVVYIFHLNK